MSLVVSALSYGVLGLDLLLVGSLLAFIYNYFSEEGLQRFELYNRLTAFIGDYARELAFLIALIATSGSLYMSNVLGWTPCRLCWFQRIFMYPLVVIIGVSILFDSRDIKDYVIPLALIGLPIALYHYITQRVEQFHAAGCSIAQVSCSTEYTFYFNYITIPMMAATAFLAILVILWRFYPHQFNSG